MMAARGTPGERLWRYVTKAGADECWPWVGRTRLKKGYGMVNVEGRAVLAHRLAWQVSNGEIPGSLHVLHRCDNPPCCNPAHLFLGTHADNMADKLAKGRGNTPLGVRTASCKLTEDDVRSMRAERAAGATMHSLATKYGVSYPTARNVVLRLKWRHVA